MTGDFKIVFTGGPCGGKSTLLPKVEKYLKEKEFNVVHVEEAPTWMHRNGILDEKLDSYLRERAIFKTRLEFEQSAVSSQGEGPKIILLDRGLFDGQAYCTGSEWCQICKYFRLKPSNLWDRYDLVIHLPSIAHHNPQAYLDLKDQNPARKESIKEAIVTDRKLTWAWAAHPNYHIIGDEDLNVRLFHILQRIDVSLVQQNQKVLV